MIQGMIFFIVFALVCIEAYPCDTKKIICDTICKTDGDEMGVVISDKCWCSNQRDITKFYTKVPKNGRVIVSKTPTYRPWVE